MHILIANNTAIPATKYGGTERVIWWLGKALTRQGHKVTYLVAKGSVCPFADIIFWDKNKPLDEQIPANVDVVHMHFPPREDRISKPHLTTIHGNGNTGEDFPINTVFVSSNHAERHNAQAFVYNGLDIEEYGPVDWNTPRKHLLFLAKASRKVKNLQQSIEIAKTLNEKIVIIGGSGFSFHPKIKYVGTIGGPTKLKYINESKALLFPVRWEEPFGLSITESMYFGVPVFGSTYGSLPELVKPDVGFISNSLSELTNAVREADSYNKMRCHEYVCDELSSKQMADKYLQYYQMVINGQPLNTTQPTTLTPETTVLLPFYA
jgi:glycosyltransferase involved in cell wall biosynthesis